jgi:ribonuclease HI
MLPKIKVNNKNDIKNDPIFIDNSKFAEIYPENIFIMRFDGCSKSNPGLAAAGAVIYHDMDELWADKFFVGENATNNHAEYAGLILGMQHALKLNIKRLVVEGDSLLVINQMTGKYKCNSSNLIELYEKAKELSNYFDLIYFNHIFRNQNKRADQLCNLAIEEYISSKCD